ncbi:MAG: hypothetical protein ACO1QB_15225 [Verrucomicrobiales bacterium]
MNISSRENRHAFTIVDLIAVAATLLLFALLSPAVFGRNKSGGRSVRCINNHQQLIRAWTLYAQDHNGELVGNYHGGEAMDMSLTGSKTPWAMGWLDWGRRTDNTNALLFTDKKYGRLSPYLNRNKSIFKCPEDIYISPQQAALGWTERVRSIAMSMSIGPGNAITGPWDPSMYVQVTKLSELRFPSPTETLIFLDEHPDSMNDPGFQNPQLNRWVDLAAAFHNKGGAISFADGRVEIHKWTGRAPLTPVLANGSFPATTAIDRADISWVSYHTQRRTEKSY